MAIAELDRTGLKEALKHWKMPKPSKGQCVIYYHNCVVSPSNTEIGFVKTVSDRLIAVNVRGTGYASVYHKDDPRLHYQPELKNDINGVWEYGQHDTEINARIEYLESMVGALAEQIEDWKNAKPAKAPVSRKKKVDEGTGDQ